MRLEEFEDFLWLANELEQDLLEDLMSEPPHGHNHGRERGQAGGWHPLETDPRDGPSYKRHAYGHVLPPGERHGVAAYQSRGCRCSVCKEAWARYMRERREQQAP